MAKKKTATNDETHNEEQVSHDYPLIFLRCLKQDLAQTRLDQGLMQRPMYVNKYKNELFDVENLALRYYSLHESMNGMHCENSLGKSLFGLLFWEVIFESKVPYVWQTPYQAVPLDFGTKDFYIQRKTLIEDRISAIEKMTREELQCEIQTKYNAHKNKHNVLVNWDS